MECKRLIFNEHAVQRMFEHAITKADVEKVLLSGKIIIKYLKDKPFPSYLVLDFIEGRPLHVVVAIGKNPQIYYVITTYDPDSHFWGSDFKKRKKR